MCPDQAICYPLSYICDNYVDCPGGSDEMNCTTGEEDTTHQLSVNT